MLKESTSKQDPAIAVTPDFRPRMLWRVVEVAPADGFRLYVRFVDGTAGTVDMSGLIASVRAGVFAQLADRSRFAQVFVQQGAVAWPGELDLAPDAMYAEIKKHGEWRLT